MNPITKIKEISLQRLNNAEYTQFLSNIQNLVEVATPEKLGFTEELFEGFKANVEALTDIAKQSKISDETAELNALDKKRNEEAVYLLNAIKNDRKTPIEEKKKVAISLYNTTKPYIGLQKLPKRQATQTIESLVSDLEKPENAGNVSKLGLTEVLSTLKATNLRYKELTANRAESQVVANLESAKAVRKRADGQYDEIITRAFVASVANPTEQTKTFVLRLNKLIEDTQLAYKLRGTRKKEADNQ